MKKNRFLLIALLVCSVSVVSADTVLAPDFTAGQLNYTNASGKKHYADLRDGTPKFTAGALELDGQELTYNAYKVVNLNNGTVSFDIEALNFDANEWKAGENQQITLFAVASDSGYSQLWLFLTPRSNGGSIGFYSWDNQRAIVKAIGHLEKYPGALRQDKRTRIAATWDPQTIRLFVNGQEIANGSYGLGSDRVISPEMLVRLMPIVYGGKTIKNLRSRISNFYIADHTKTPAEIQAEYDSSRTTGKNLLSLNALSVPKLRTVPVIDGKLTPGEWDDAARIPLQKQNFRTLVDSEIGASVQVKHDEQNLYCLFAIPERHAPELPGAAGTFTDKIYNGSLVEVYLRRNGSSLNDYYQYTVSPNNAYAVMTPNAKLADIAFAHQTCITPEGYTVEMAIPLASAGLNGVREFAANFGLHLPERDDIAKADRWIAWSGIQYNSFAVQCGTLQLADTPGASRLAPISGVNYGALELTHYADVPTHAELKLYDGAGKLQLHKLFADSSAVHFRQPLGWTGGGFLDFSVSRPNGEILNRYSGKLLVKEPFDFTVRTQPAAKKIAFDIDAMGLGKRAPGTLTFKARLTDCAGQKVFAETTTCLAASRTTVTMTLPELAVGRYKLDVELQDANAVYRKSRDFERPDDKFISDPRGMTRNIPAPWSALQLNGNILRGKFFEYNFTPDSPFPATARKYTRTILSAGKLELIVNGQPQALHHTEVKIVENSPARLVTTGKLVANSAPVTIAYRRTADYDGLLRYDLRLLPSAPVMIDRFAWRGTVAPEAATYSINPNVTPSFNREYSAAASVTCRTFPIAWVTGLQYGFCAFTDNDANWVYDPAQPPLVIAKMPQDTTITVEMIAKPVKVSAPVSYVLGLMSTPGKPPRADWRQTYSDSPLTPKSSGTYYRTIGWDSEKQRFRWHRWICMTHLQNPAAARQRIAYFRSLGVQCLPYNCGSLVADNNPIYNYYGHEWRRSVGGRLQPEVEQQTDNDGTLFYGGVPVCANNVNFADYLTYYTDKFLGEYDLVGLYLDFGGVYPSDTPYHDTDLTERLTPGKPVKAWNVFGVRALYERLRKVLQSHGSDKILWIHEWDRYYPPVVSFADLIYPGEEFMHSIRVNRKVYGEDVPLQQWQVAYNSEVHGAAVQFLTQYRYYRDPIHNAKKTVAEKIDFARDLMTMLLLHDIPMSDSFTAPWHAAWDRLEMKKAIFSSYYSNVPVVTDNAAVKTALYRWPDRNTVVLVIGNTSRQSQAFRLDDSRLPLADSGVDVFNGGNVDLRKQFRFRDFDFLVLEVKLKK